MVQELDCSLNRVTDLATGRKHEDGIVLVTRRTRSAVRRVKLWGSPVPIRNLDAAF